MKKRQWSREEVTARLKEIKDCQDIFTENYKGWTISAKRRGNPVRPWAGTLDGYRLQNTFTSPRLALEAGKHWIDKRIGMLSRMRLQSPRRAVTFCTTDLEGADRELARAQTPEDTEMSKLHVDRAKRELVLAETALLAALTPLRGTDSVLDGMMRRGSPLTRDHYITMNWGIPPDNWNAQHEAEIPEPLQDWSRCPQRPTATATPPNA